MRWVSLSVLFAFVVSCGPVAPAQTGRPPGPNLDGTACTTSNDCRSLRCDQGSCAGSLCDANAPRCEPGWTCVFYPESRDLLGRTSPARDQCTPGPMTVALVTQVPAVVPLGTKLVLEARATSPVATEVPTYEWLFTDGSPGATGAQITHVCTREGALMISVSATTARTSATVNVETVVCLPAGEPCVTGQLCCSGQYCQVSGSC